ncbi:MAG: hypothetical protein ACSHYF_04105 [Verrucomicrobiaceae bacterium]
MRGLFPVLVAVLMGSCARGPDGGDAELVMWPGMEIEATTSQGTMRVLSVDRMRRRYVWEGYDKTFRHQERRTRWDGSLGMYRPQGDGSMHAVLEEGQQHFGSMEEARGWLAKKGRFMDYVWTEDGLVVGWKEQGRPGDGFVALHVEVWQILVKGEKPEMRGAAPGRIRVVGG